MRRTRASSLGAAAALFGSACASIGPAGRAHTPEQDWTIAQATATAEVLNGRYGVADKALSDFATRHPTRAEAAEALFSRAIFKLDPMNGTATPRDAGLLLDSYLAIPQASVHRAEATVLRRIAAVLERGAAAGGAPSAPGTAGGTPTSPAPGRADERAKDEEIQRLKDELAKANAELERIRRRLATPRP